MDNLMQSLSSMIKPDMAAALGKALGADTSSINQGLATVGPLAMGNMAKVANTPGGAESLLKMLPQGGGALGNIGSLISGLTGGGSGGGMVNSVMGPGVNAIGASLSKTLGFEVTPLLRMVVPVVGGLVARAVKADNLDAAGLKTVLNKQSADFANDPANKATMALVNDANAAGEKAAAQIASYGADWPKVAGGPAAALLLDYVLVVAVGISAGVGALVSAVPVLQPHTLSICLLICCANLFAKKWTRSGMSSGRSRSGGTLIGKTFNR